MGTSTVVNLFQTGGVILVFICFLVWLIRYFMSQIDKFTEERKSLQQQFDLIIDNHCMKVTEALLEQRHKFEMLITKLDELVYALRDHTQQNRQAGD